MDNKLSIIFEPKSNPCASEVFQLPKYFGNFNNFISHAISICSKSSSCDCGDTNHGSVFTIGKSKIKNFYLEGQEPT
jgi:hypothetical protein